jgi:hypothetical protein
VNLAPSARSRYRLIAKRISAGLTPARQRATKCSSSAWRTKPSSCAIAAVVAAHSAPAGAGTFTVAPRAVWRTNQTSWQRNVGRRGNGARLLGAKKRRAGKRRLQSGKRCGMAGRCRTKARYPGGVKKKITVRPDRSQRLDDLAWWRTRLHPLRCEMNGCKTLLNSRNPGPFCLRHTGRRTPDGEGEREDE